MQKIGNLLLFGLMAGLAVAIPLFVYLALDAVLYAFKVVGVFVGGTGLAVLSFIGITRWRSDSDRRRRPVDGSFSLIEMDDEQGGKIYIDMNKSTSGIVHANPRYGVHEYESPIGPDRQLAYAQSVQTTRSLMTMQPGDDALVRGRGAFGMGKSGIPNVATAKWLEGNYRPKDVRVIGQDPALPAPPAVPVARLSLTDALSKSTGERWIVGQGDGGELAVFEPARHFSIGVIGASGTGKTTSIAFGVVLNAIRSGWKVVVINPDGNRPPPDGGAGWNLFEGAVELHETDPSAFPGQVEAIYNLYEQRATTTNPRPVLVVWEEYGDTYRHLKTRSRNDADAVDVMLDTILQRGRKHRVHMAFVDQYPENWSNAVLGGTKFKTVFQLGPGQGSKVEEYGAGKLPPVGRFLVRGVEYSSFDASAAVPAILRQLPANSSSRRVINGVAVPVSAGPATPAPAVDADGWVGGSVSGSVAGSFGGSEGFVPEVAPPSPAVSEPTEPSGPTDYQRAAVAFVKAFPDCNQTELKDALGIAKSYAHDLWHAHHPKGKNYKLPTDSMDLTNEADREAFEQLVRSGVVSYPEPKEK